MAVGIIIYHIFKEKYRHIVFMMICWFFLMLWGILAVLTYLFLDLDLSRFRHYTFIPIAFSMSLLLDSLTKESYDPLKLIFITTFSTALFIFSLNPNLTNFFFFPNGEITLAATGPYRISISILTGFTGFLYFLYMLRIHLNAPKNLKFYSLLNLVGGILVGIGGPLVVLTGLNLIIPGIEAFFTAGGALFCSISFVNRPKLAYILPFRAVKLVVIEINRGITLFSHSWIEEEEIIENIQLTAMISSVSRFIEEVLQKGGVKELNLEQATLIMHQYDNSPIYSIIITNKSNKSLRNALTRFSKSFFKEYSKYLPSSLDTEKYKTASKLVREHFPFVPEYNVQ
ncbi:MAG: hypothetical protein ACFFDN_35765 [Candidatus Hodarchaeota archaeon]